MSASFFVVGAGEGRPAGLDRCVRVFPAGRQHGRGSRQGSAQPVSFPRSRKRQRPNRRHNAAAVLRCRRARDTVRPKGERTAWWTTASEPTSRPGRTPSSPSRAENGRVTVDGLASHFDVTPQTIRKDLNDLATRRELTRVHGGAIAPSGHRQPRIREAASDRGRGEGRHRPRRRGADPQRGLAVRQHRHHH